MRQKKKYNILSGCGAAGSARGLGPRGPEFETLHSDHQKSTSSEVLLIFFGYLIFELNFLLAALTERKTVIQTAKYTATKIPKKMRITFGSKGIQVLPM